MSKELTVTLLPPQVQREARKIVPAAVFDNMRFLTKLPEKVQNEVREEGQQLAAAMMVHGASRLAIGKHLDSLHELLEPHSMFYKFVRKFTNYNVRTAYRYINGYNNAKATVPEPVLNAAMARGIALIGDDEKRPLGIYTEAYRALGPAPRNADPAIVNKYLDDLENVRKEQRKRQAKRKSKKAHQEDTEAKTGDPNELLKRAYRFVSTSYKKVPGGAKKRVVWMERLMGMLLRDMGATSITVNAEAVPEDFIAKRGRPSLQERPEEQPVEAVQ